MASFAQRGVQRLARWQPSLLLWLDLLLVTLISSLSIAQTTTSGGLTGVVTDPSGAVVFDAAVEIRNTSKGTNQSLKTDRGGAYQFSFLAPARYTLTVAHAGFQTENRAVDVLLGPPVTVNVALRVAQATTTVSVTAEAALVHAENGDVSTTMNQQQVSEVPNPGNDLTYIAQTAPGAIMNTDAIGFGGSGNFSILGMPGTSNLFTLNGMNDIFGLKQLGLTFELKGGTSLSKGFGVIHRFSEDIDIRIEPFDGLQVDTNPNHDKPQHIDSRRQFYKKLREKIKISGITAVERDKTYGREDKTCREQ